MKEIDKLRELFNSDDFIQIQTAINLVISLNDKEIYSKCLSGWTTSRREIDEPYKEEVELKFDSKTIDKDLIESETPVIKNNDWANKSRGYAVLMLLEKAPKETILNSSLSLESLTKVDLRGVGIVVLPTFLKKCKSLEKLNIENCNELASIDDEKLLQKIFQNNPQNIIHIIDKITADTSKLEKSFKEELNVCFYKKISSDVEKINGENSISINEYIRSGWGKDGIKRKENNIRITKLINKIHHYLNNSKINSIVYGISLLETKLFNVKINQATTKVIDYLIPLLSEGSNVSISGPEINWEEIQIEPIIYKILSVETDRKLAFNLNGDWDGWYVKFLEQVCQKNEVWFISLMMKIKLSNSFGVMGGEGWTPKILFDGSVLFRNHHRVIAPKYESTVFFNDEKILEFLKEINKINSNSKIIVTTYSGEITEVNDATQITKESIINGNNFISIHNREEIDNCSFEVRKYLSYIYSSTRSAIMLRLVKGGISFYSDYRADDKYDYLIERLPLVSFFSEERELPNKTGIQLQKTPFESKDLTWEKNIENREGYVYDRVLDDFYFDNFQEGLFVNPKKSLMQNSNQLKLLPIELTYSNLANYMNSEYAETYWFTKIFGKDKEFPMNYSGEYKLNKFFRDQDFNVCLKYRMGYEIQKTSLENIHLFTEMMFSRILKRFLELSPFVPEKGFEKDTEWINEDCCEDTKKSKKMFYDQIKNIENISLHFYIPKIDEKEVKTQFKNRIVTPHYETISDGKVTKFKEDAEWVELKLEYNEFNEISINKSDVTFIKKFINLYVENKCEGDWSYLADEWWEMFAMYIRMPEGAFLDFEQLGKELTNTSWNESSGDEFNGLLANTVAISIPDAGVYQGFDSGDFDSGNM